MFCVAIDYPSEQEELDIVKRTTADLAPVVQTVLSAEDLIALREVVRRVSHRRSCRGPCRETGTHEPT